MSEQPMAFEEVPGSRTTQQAVDQPQRERIAYEELKPGDAIQPGDEWQNEDGRWHPLVLTLGASTQVRKGLRARRPHNITLLHNSAHAAVTQLEAVCREWSARLEAEITAARVVADELTAAKEALKSAQRARDELQLQVDELRADRERLQGLIDNLLDEPTARQVRDMLRTWATELDWSAGCFDSAGREQIDTIQKTLVAVIERIEGLVNPEGNTDGE